MRTLLFFCCSALFAFESGPLAFLVLDTTKAPDGKLPGWDLKVVSGKPDFSVISDGDASVLHFKSAKSSFALERSLDVDVAKLPYLGWRWKVTQVPKGGDFRHFWSDDQAAQVLVAFDDRHILSYLWDTSAPQGMMEAASSPPLIHIFGIVCRSGMNDANKWIVESHDVVADYKKAFGKPPMHVKGLRLQINSQHTGTAAESYFADVAFRSLP